MVSVNRISGRSGRLGDGGGGEAGAREEEGI
jgi:hypothetical protein